MAESPESLAPTVSPEVIAIALPLLFGPLFIFALYGILCVQIYVYSYNFPDDRRPIKVLAYFVFVVETVQTALTGCDVYYWFIAGFGDVERLSHSHFAPVDVPLIGAFISLVVQEYFCYRIWVLKNKRFSWICWVIAVSAVAQSGMMIWTSIRALIAGSYANSKTAFYVWSVLSSLADILIAVAMTLLLRNAGGRFSSFVLTRVVRLTVETNTLTAAMAIANVVLYAAFPNKLYYAIISEVIGKLYSNTLLVSLNNRIYFREHQLPEHGDSVHIPVHLPVSDRQRRQATALSSLRFAESEPQPQSSKPEAVILPLYIIPDHGA